MSKTTQMPVSDNYISGSDASGNLTPISSLVNSSEDQNFGDIPIGAFNDPDNDIVEDLPEIFEGRKIPKVLVPTNIWMEGIGNNNWSETLSVPANMSGVLIGRFGKNVRELKNRWNAELTLNVCPGQQDALLLSISCPLEHKDSVIQWISNRIKMRPSRTTIGNPNQLRRNLLLGELTKIQIRSLFGLKEFFVTICDAEFERYLEMQKQMDKEYAVINNFRAQLHEPVTSGTVAILPHKFGFARALVLRIFFISPRLAFCFLLDHGTFGVVDLNELRKIKAKFMKVPFQAIHVNWAHALPIFYDIPDLHVLRTIFNSGRAHAYAVRMETCCRSSVVLLDRNSYGSPHDFNDYLAVACQRGLYLINNLYLYNNRQIWLNRAGTSYFSCPYGEVDYTKHVYYLTDGQLTSPLPYAVGMNNSLTNLPNFKQIPRQMHPSYDVPQPSNGARNFKKYAVSRFSRAKRNDPKNQPLNPPYKAPPSGKENAHVSSVSSGDNVLPH